MKRAPRLGSRWGFVLGCLVLAGCGSAFKGEDAGAGGAGSGGDAGGGKAGSSGGSAGSGGNASGGAAGSGGSATGGSSSGGSSSGGTAGSGGPCDGRPCGATCSDCPPGEVCPAVERYCDAQGACGVAFPICEVQGCTDPSECVAPGVCQTCADGSAVCATADCVGGQCVTSFPTCPDSCDIDGDCPPIRAPCQLCPDGSAACPFSRCVNGTCTTGFDSCGAYDPCAGKSCGDHCSPCDPADPTCVAPAVVMYCDATGSCGLTMPLCARCEDVSCLRPFECVRECGGPVEYTGCCPCEPPLFDQFTNCAM